MKMVVKGSEPAGSAVVLFTSELLNNLRKGQPPIIPDYSKVALWRNESVCLSEVSGKNLRKLRAGITWCEPKNKSITNVDLDLSVTLFDKDWQEIASCSYSNTKLNGRSVLHSGDVRSAPYPHGGRESIDIDLDLVDQHYPNCQYIGLQVYSFCGHAFEDLHDASVFVSDPTTTGDGPGGTAILSAARLTGKGAQSVAGFLYFDYYSRTHLFCTDATLAVQNRSTVQGVGICGSICKMVFDEHCSTLPKTLRGIDVALLTAATLNQQIILVAAEEEGDKTANVQKCIVVKREGLNSFEFYMKAAQIALAAVPTHGHTLPSSELFPDLKNEPVLLISGDLPMFEALVVSLPSDFLQQKNRQLKVLNVGVDITKTMPREVALVEGEVEYVQGPGALKLLTGLAE
jgi:stress response protein SCP2